MQSKLVKPDADLLQLQTLCPLPHDANSTDLERVAVCNAAAASACNHDKELITAFFACVEAGHGYHRCRKELDQ